MTIYSDPTNSRIGSSLQHYPIPNEIITPGLEGLSGSDYIVSPANHPIRKWFDIQQHLDAGALLIQVKVGADLLSSVGDRLKASMLTMLSFTCAPCQRCLLPVGYTLCDEDYRAFIGMQSKTACTVFGVEGKKLLNGGYTPNYKAYNTSLVEWGLRGGFVLPTIPHMDLFVWAMQDLERILVETAKDANRYVLDVAEKVADQPNEDKQSLQVLKSVPEGVNVLAAQPGIGARRAIEYYAFYEGDLMIAIVNLCSSDGNHPAGWGPTRAATLAKVWGITTKEKA